jgi:hypothetical protein
MYLHSNVMGHEICGSHGGEDVDVSLLLVTPCGLAVFNLFKSGSVERRCRRANDQRKGDRRKKPFEERAANKNGGKWRSSEGLHQ